MARPAAPQFAGGLDPNDVPHPFADWSPAELAMVDNPDLTDDDVGPYEALRRLNAETQRVFSLWLNAMVILFGFFVSLRFL